MAAGVEALTERRAILPSGALLEVLHNVAWESRRSGSYYYRARREAGRVRKEYVGGGEVAALVAGIDAAERAERAEQREAERAERERLEAGDAALADLDRAADRAVAEALTGAGFHRHKREWRKRRG